MYLKLRRVKISIIVIKISNLREVISSRTVLEKQNPTNPLDLIAYILDCNRDSSKDSEDKH